MACSSACSKEFNRKELQNLLSSVLDNLDNGNVKKLSDEQFKALFHFLNGRDTFACLLIGLGFDNRIQVNFNLCFHLC